MSDQPGPDARSIPRVGTKRAAAVLASGSGVNFILRFLRQVLLARLLSVADFGIVGTFMAALNLLQMTSSFNFQLLLVQDRKGDDPDFMSAIKGLAVAREVILALAVVALGGPLASLMGQPDLAWAYRCMAIVPFLTAFLHPDMQRMKRHMKFGPEILTTASGSLLSLILVWPLVLLIGDYRVALVLYAVQTLTELAVSHRIAEYPFRVGWDRQIAWKGLRFGWPLMASGLLLFVVMQGDRILVANFYSAEALGLIAAVLTMVLTPVQFAGQLVRTYFLSVLSRHQDDAARFADRGAFTLQATLCAGLGASLGFAFLGPTVLILVFGEKFAEGGTYVALLGIAFALQMMRNGPATVALARGHTVNMLIGNLARIAFFVPALAAAVAGVDILIVFAIGVVGQLVAVAVNMTLIYTRTGLGRPQAMAAPCLCALATLAALGLAIWQAPVGYVTVGWASALSVVFFLASVATSRTMQRHLIQQYLT